MEGIKHDKMKYRLAEAMKNCMKKMPVEKITVKTNKQGSEVSEEDKRTRRTLEDEMTFFVCVNLYIDILSK